MLFHSFEFVWIVLPVGLCGYYLLGHDNTSFARMWLLSISLVYYFLGIRSSIFLLLFSIFSNFLLSSFLEKKPAGWSKKILLWVGILLNIGPLILYKGFSSFYDSSIVDGPLVFTDALVPLGLSFFSLQQVAFLIDVYQKKIGRESFLNYALFVAFFPQLIAGPIVRFQELVPQFKERSTFRFQYENLVIGVTIFILGAAKKIYCADHAGIVANAVFGSVAAGGTPTLLEAWVGALSFSLQLYFDFSAYSDMSIGIARMFAIKLPINFNSPFRAKGILDAFTRWHITLYRYFSDYLVKPMFSYLIRLPLGRKITRTRIAVSVCTGSLLLLSGFWHGLSLNFILWGLLNAVFAVGFYLWKEFKRDHGITWAISSKIGHGLFSCLFIATLLPIGVCFRVQEMSGIATMLASMAGLNGVSLSSHFQESLAWLQPFGVDFYGFFPITRIPGGGLGCFRLLIGPLLIVSFLPNIYEFLKNYSPALGTDRILRTYRYFQWQPSKKWAFVMAGMTLVVICCAFSANYTLSAFEYFRF